jgi:hypothetical protein
LCSVSQIKTSFYVDGKLNEVFEISDSLALINWIESYKIKAITEGYYFSGIDSTRKVDNELIYYFHKGLPSDNAITDLKSKKLTKRLQARVKYLGQKGYPFATIRIDSSRIQNGLLTGKIIEEKGPYIQNDSAFFFEPVKTKESYIYQLLDHVPGKPFNESNYSNVNKKMGRSSFLSLKRPVDISFQDNKAKLYLDVEESTSSSFQGVVGLQQQTSGKSQLIGSFDLKIENLFRSGKELGINWQSFGGSSQDLAFYYDHPFVLGSSLKPYFEFELLKQDSTFLKRSTSIGVGTYVNSTIEVEIGYTHNNGSLLTTEERTLSNSDLADFNSDKYNIRLKRGSLGQFNKVQSNYAWEMGVIVGSKQIDRNVNLTDSFYDSLLLKTDIFQFELKTNFNKQIAKRQSIFQELTIGVIDNEELLNNERYRLGGLTTVRGFNEKFFFADKFLLSRTEFRSFFEKGSFAYLFFDQLFIERDGKSSKPFGTGIGFLLSTSSGQFSFAMALGKTEGQSINFSNMKAHFGYITNF